MTMASILLSIAAEMTDKLSGHTDTPRSSIEVSNATKGISSPLKDFMQPSRWFNSKDNRRCNLWRLFNSSWPREATIANFPTDWLWPCPGPSPGPWPSPWITDVRDDPVENGISYFWHNADSSKSALTGCVALSIERVCYSEYWQGVLQWVLRERDVYITPICWSWEIMETKNADNLFKPRKKMGELITRDRVVTT